MKLSRLILFSLILSATVVHSLASIAQKGEFVTLQQPDGASLRSYVAGPEDAAAGVMVVQDYFGISDATGRCRLASTG